MGGRRTKWRQTSLSKPLVASYLKRPRRSDAGWRGQRRLAGHARLVGRDGQLTVLDEAVRDATSGVGSVVFIVGDPGLGKTRLVQECRKRFMAWVVAPQAGCRSGWRDVALHTPRQRLMASTNNFSMRGSAWCRKRAKRWCVPLWNVR